MVGAWLGSSLVGDEQEFGRKHEKQLIAEKQLMADNGNETSTNPSSAKTVEKKVKFSAAITNICGSELNGIFCEIT